MSEITFEAEFWFEEGQYVARANPLDIMSCGATPKHAEMALLEAVELFLETAGDKGTLEEILLEAGYSRTAQGGWTPRAPERREITMRIQPCPA